MQNRPSTFSLSACCISLFLLVSFFSSQSLFAQQSPEPPVPQTPSQTPEEHPSKLKQAWQKIRDKITPDRKIEPEDDLPEQTHPVVEKDKGDKKLSEESTDSTEKDKKVTPVVPAKPAPPKHTVAMTADGYQLAMPGYQFKFPRDHASHPQFKTEWWYYTGHLKADDGDRFGYELTFFRSGIPLKHPPSRSVWALKDIYAAHFAVTDLARHQFTVAERLNRNSPYQGTGQAQADSDRFYVLNDTWGTWQIKQQPKSPTAKTTVKTVKASDAGKDAILPEFWLQADMNAGDQTDPKKQYRLKLRLTPLKVPVAHGKNGISQKANCKGCASHYYSLTRLQSNGTLWADGKIKRVSGISWMDREFGSNQLTLEQSGWDWFSLQLDNQTELMLYILRNEKTKDGKLVQYIDPNSSGTLVFADGKTVHLNKSAFKIKALDQWESPKTKAKYPMGWQIDIPAYRVRLWLQPEMKDQELVTQQSTKVAYWEGSNKVSGWMQGKHVKGSAYVEMTGYAQKFRQRI